MLLLLLFCFLRSKSKSISDKSLKVLGSAHGQAPPLASPGLQRANFGAYA
jgi:hypothetical protein